MKNIEVKSETLGEDTGNPELWGYAPTNASLAEAGVISGDDTSRLVKAAREVKKAQIGCAGKTDSMLNDEQWSAVCQVTDENWQQYLIPAMVITEGREYPHPSGWWAKP